jgi:hypothetical protein
MSRAARAVIALCGCGRVGFDNLPPDATPICTTPFGAPSLIPGVNTVDAELGPVVSADGREIMFYSRRAGGVGLSDEWRASRPDADSPFAAAVVIANVNTTFEDGGASISRDGLTLYFSSDRPGGVGDSDIWTATRSSVGSPFGAPVPVPEVNSDTTEYDPIISPDGLELYLSSRRPGGLGGFDIWRASRTDTSSAFGTPVNVTELNSPGHDNGGRETLDRRLVLFSRGVPADAQTDLWWATRSGPGQPYEALTVLDSLNSPGFELGPMISQDGQTIYFSSSRPGMGSDDLYFATRTCP